MKVGFHLPLRRDFQVNAWVALREALDPPCVSLHFPGDRKAPSRAEWLDTNL
jgi:hypothetical protein